MNRHTQGIVERPLEKWGNLSASDILQDWGVMLKEQVAPRLTQDELSELGKLMIRLSSYMAE